MECLPRLRASLLSEEDSEDESARFGSGVAEIPRDPEDRRWEVKSKKRVRNDDGPRHVTPAGRSVFFDLFEAEEAMELEVRATLLDGLARWLTDSGMTQTEAAKALGVTQARVSELKRGKISLFSIYLLFRLAARVGLHTLLKLAS
jgi:predicted XRE-type DNA-binding protein